MDSGDKIKLMWHSDSVLASTGFATVSFDVLSRLHNTGKYDIRDICWNTSFEDKLEHVKFSDGREINYTLLSGGRQQYAIDKIPLYLAEHRPDLFCTLLDTFMIQPHLGALNFAPAKTAFYYPSDGEYFPDHCDQVLRKYDVPIAMSKFARDQVADIYGIHSEYIPHGVNNQHYYPFKDEDKAKAKMSFGIPPDKKVFGAVFRNQPRKMPAEKFKAFGKFARDKDDVVMLVHSDPQDVAAHVDLKALVQRYGIAHKVYWTGMTFFNAFPLERMKQVYNAMDFYISSTSGEGWGLCCHPETQIRTRFHSKKIKDIEVGSKVLTHKGTYKRVVKKFKRKVKEKLVCIKPYGANREVKLTKEHPVLAIRRPNKKYKTPMGTVLSRKKPDWIEAGKLQKGDIVAFPKLNYGTKQEAYLKFDVAPWTYDLTDFDKNILVDGHDSSVYYKTGYSGKRKKYLKKYPRFVHLDNGLAYVMGWYVAEGSGCGGKIEFSMHKKEREHAEEIIRVMYLKFGTVGTILIKGNKLRLQFSGKILEKFFNKVCGKGAYNKHIPVEMFINPVYDVFEGFMTGLYLGDGHKHKTGQVLTTKSKKLAEDVFVALIAMSYKPQFCKTKEGAYRVNFTFDKSISHNNKSWIVNDYVYFLIRDVHEEDYSGYVYNIEVEGDNSYVTDSFAVHNCTVEAMACGVPVIITDFTTTKEIVFDHNAGLPVRLRGLDKWTWELPRKDVEMASLCGSWSVERGMCDNNHFAEQLQYAYDNPDELKRMGLNGHKAAVEHYDYDKVVAPAFDKLFTRMVHGE